MARKSFNYPHTCPEIDRGISDAKDSIGRELVSIVQYLKSEFDVTIDDTQVDDWIENIYTQVEGAFEAVRDSNVDIRSAAEERIDELLNEIGDLENEIDNLRDEISDLSCKIEKT